MDVPRGDPQSVLNLGSMAGTPLADLLFTVSISRILYVFRKTLVQDDLESMVVIGETLHTLCDVSSVADTAAPMTDPASSVIDKSSAVAQVAFNVFLPSWF